MFHISKVLDIRIFNAIPAHVCSYLWNKKLTKTTCGVRKKSTKAIQSLQVKSLEPTNQQNIQNNQWKS